MIHSSSIIDKKAKIGKNVKIGPFCYVGPQVEINDEVELISNVHIEGNSKIGKGTKIFPFASIGTQPQDLKYKGEDTSLEIGENNMIREYVTINPGTAGGASRAGLREPLAVAAGGRIPTGSNQRDNLPDRRGSRDRPSETSHGRGGHRPHHAGQVVTDPRG